MNERNTGYYWVKQTSIMVWQIGWWSIMTQRWSFVGNTSLLKESEIAEVDENKISKI